MRRSLTHYRAIHVAVVLGAAVATATLTGSLVVGDSVKASLRALTLDRLGATDDALSSERLFRATLAADDAFAESYTSLAPAILLNGAARAASGGRRASGVQIVGADARFAAQYASSVALVEGLAASNGGRVPPVVINEALSRELSAAVGDELLLSFGRRGDVHPESLFGSRDAADARGLMRVVVSGVVPDRGVGRFALRPHQHAPMNAFVPLDALQRTLDRAGDVNLMLATRGPTTAGAAALLDAADKALTVADLGLRIREYDDVLIIESEQLVLSDGIAEAIMAAASDVAMEPLPVLTYVATRMAIDGREASYAMVAAVDRPTLPPPNAHAGALTEAEPAPGRSIVLSEWLAQDLGASPGDEVLMSYFVVAPDETLLSREASFVVAATSPPAGLVADRRLTPAIEGLGDADDIGDWDAPFPVDMSRVTERDEDYWDSYGATPKAFVSLRDGQDLWAGRFGSLTSVRLTPKPGQSTHTASEEFGRALLARARPSQAGFAAHAVREDGLAAATGATDFSGLFVGFSMFLIAASALLTQLLFRLGVEHRAREIGTLLAVGFPAAAVRRRFLGEGALLAVIGATVGVGVGVGYAWLMIAGLRTLWVGAVGTRDLALHVRAGSLALGWGISVVVVAAAIALAVRRLGRIPARALLSGSAPDLHTSTPRVARLVATPASVLSALIMGYGLLTGAAASPSLFFASGALALVGGLAHFATWLGRAGRRRRELRATIDLSARSAARRPSRSMLSATLIACACFVIVAVGLNRHAPLSREEARDPASGSGGFALVAEADIPLHHDLNTPEGRFELGLAAKAESLLAESPVLALRTVPGEDASCLNLHRPSVPTLVGVTDAFISREAFTFTDAIDGAGGPWELLRRDFGPGVIPAIADANSAQWILHIGVGDDLVTTNEVGHQIRLRLVGMLATSVLQSVMLVSDDALRANFPGRSGAAFFLIDAPPGGADDLLAALEGGLAAYGFDAMPTDAKLAQFRAVEDTYLSTFQALGGLGLLLGTAGLAVVLLRNMIERRGELATLRAFGFRRGTLLVMLIVENAFLVAVGLSVGTVAALIAVLPAITAADAHVPWGSVGATLVAVFACAVAAT
ncbi:ABC transporter permease, partial [Candidatus Poribacteria bacterium]|nr:ABC transporter permease [Candidatus Poribacteria bacterium]